MYVQLMANLYNSDAKMHLLEPGPSRDLPTLHMLESMCVMDLPLRKRLQDGQAQEETQFAPNTGVIMFRLISAMDAIKKHIRFDLDREKYSLIQNGMVFPVTAASLEFRELGAHPEWKTTLGSFREHLSKRDPFNFLKVIFELLDEAQASGTEVFDINEGARGRGIEVVLF
ncbi:unnamed protein product [Colletotrichum noveboracense]|uniref:Uncharacterized protein n=1 Tax=Colletotrichum noveboracense TaxID=2664923 RepID=A0A9W4W708_9PEZI|nr:unnamed protein product [Colletotrichum noveboracense]